MTEPRRFTEPEAHRFFAVEANNRAWSLLDAGDAASARRAVDLAHAARWHWGEVPTATPANDVRACCLVARAHAAAGSAGAALEYAEITLRGCQENGLLDWDLAFAHLAKGHAFYAAGDRDGARLALEAARRTPIADPEDGAIVRAEIEKLETRLWA